MTPRQRKAGGAGRRLLQVLAATAGVYLLACLALRLGYRTLLYPAPPHPQPFRPASGVQALASRASDGAPVFAVEIPPPGPGARTVVVFHGNGETLEGRMGLALGLARRGLGVVLAEYRGYGDAAASGAPDEAGLYADASAVLDELARRGTGPSQVALVGISLGSGVAAEMASRGRAAALVLVSPYTSMPDVAARVLPLVPARWLCPDRYDTLSKAPSLRVPTLIVHGEEDELVPFAMGRTLAQAIPGATLRAVPGRHHNDLFAGDPDGLVDAIAAAATR
jgi:pimeloyl-ACP methyl ester carboxylesterase